MPNHFWNTVCGPQSYIVCNCSKKNLYKHERGITDKALDPADNKHVMCNGGGLELESKATVEDADGETHVQVPTN